jgi:hypothetical protein
MPELESLILKALTRANVIRELAADWAVLTSRTLQKSPILQGLPAFRPRQRALECAASSRRFCLLMRPEKKR